MALPHLQDIFGPTRCITQGWKHWNSSESGQHTTGAITKIHLKTLLCVFLVYDHPYLNPRALVESFHRPIKYGGCFVFFCWFFLLLVFFLFCFEVDSKTHHKYKLCFVFFGVVVVVVVFFGGTDEEKHEEAKPLKKIEQTNIHIRTATVPNPSSNCQDTSPGQARRYAEAFASTSWDSARDWMCQGNPR